MISDDGLSSEDRQSLSAVKAKQVDYVFKTFKRRFKQKFTSKFPTDAVLEDEKRYWLQNWDTFTDKQIKRAVNRFCATEEWPPTVLAEFLKYCRNTYSEHDLPFPSVAYREARMARTNPERFKFSHVAIFHAGRELGWNRLEATGLKIRDEFIAQYDIQCDVIREGKRLPGKFIEGYKPPELAADEFIVAGKRRQVDSQFRNVTGPAGLRKAIAI